MPVEDGLDANTSHAAQAATHTKSSILDHSTPETPFSPLQASPGWLRVMPGQRPPNELVTSHPAAFFPDSDREAVKDAGRKNTHRPPRLDIADVFARDTVNGVGQPGSLSEAVGQDGWNPISTADPPTEKHSEEDEDLGEEPGWIKGALIGEGAFGQVYLGMNTVTGLLMAVKQARIPDDSMLDARRLKAKLAALEHEINLLQDLRHTNIVGYLRSAFDEEHLNIFLEYVPGGSVASLLSSYGAFEETLVQNFLRQILRGLEYLHAKEIIHCDIKGANVLVDNNGHIKLSDFGISKRSDAAYASDESYVQGSIFWMAPEVINYTAHSTKSDIWSIGCLIVEMLTSEHPWASLTHLQAVAKISSLSQPEMPADISQDAKEFLALTFDIEYEKRPSALDALSHPWLATGRGASATASDG